MNSNLYRSSHFALMGSVIVLLVVQGTVSGYTGKEITIKLGNAQFAPLNDTNNYQIKLAVNYSVSDPALIGQKINAVTKIHSSNGTVIKTTSFPSGFVANKTDTAELLTNIPKLTAQNVTTETVFTTLNKSNVLSNSVKTLPTLSGPLKSSEFTPTVITNKT